jgi:uncharacterized membrane protein required for colicin V production
MVLYSKKHLSVIILYFQILLLCSVHINTVLGVSVEQVSFSFMWRVVAFCFHCLYPHSMYYSISSWWRCFHFIAIVMLSCRLVAAHSF